jgi:predicted nucleic acid-binding protein
MSGISVLIDTNIAIALLNGDEQIASLFDGKDVRISFISELDLLCKPGMNSSEKKNIHAFIDDCTILEINPSIKEITISIKQSNKIKLPDAIIAATSIFWNLPFFTRDEDFKNIKGLNCFFVNF